MATSSPWSAAVRGAGATVVTLFGGTLVGVVLGEITFEVLPGHSLEAPRPLNIALAAIPAVSGLLAGSAAWGILMGRLARFGNGRRMAVAGILGFVPITIVLAVALLSLEPIAVEQLGSQLPVHRVFTLFFVPTAFLIGGASAWAIGRGLNDGTQAWRMALRVGLVSAAAFLVINLAMEAAGWVVGAPRAAERFTMLTVMFAGMIGAALTGGFVLGWTLAVRPLKG